MVVESSGCCLHLLYISLGPMQFAACLCDRNQSSRLPSQYSTRTLKRTISEGGRVCIINVFKIKSPHEESCNYLYYRLTLAFFPMTTFGETMKIGHGGGSQWAACHQVRRCTNLQLYIYL